MDSIFVNALWVLLLGSLLGLELIGKVPPTLHTPLMSGANAISGITVLAALTYLLVPLDLIPDLLPVIGFSDDLVALTALLGLCSTHINDTIRLRAQRKLDRWFPLGR